MEKHKEFKPFDKVLVKVLTDEKWTPDLYSYYDDIKNLHWSIGCGWVSDENILPYEGNEHLVGTTDEPDEEVRLEKGELLVCSDDLERLKTSHGVIENFVRTTSDGFQIEQRGYSYNFCIRFKDFNPNDMEATKAKILCVKNGKVVKFRN